MDPNSGIEVCGKGRGRGTGRGREGEKIWEVERKGGEDSTRNKVFHPSRKKSGPSKKGEWEGEEEEEEEEGLEVLRLVCPRIGMRTGVSRAVCKEVTNLTRLPLPLNDDELEFGVESEDERESACLRLKRGKREGHNESEKRRNRVAWPWRGVAVLTVQHS